MDGLNNSSSGFGELTEHLHHLGRSVRIQASCGLIQEDQAGVCYKFYSDGCSFSLSARHTFQQRASDEAIPAFFKFQIQDELVDSGDLVLLGAWQLELRSK